MDIARNLYRKIDPARLRDLTLEFVQTPSPTGSERRFSRLLARHLRQAGMQVRMDEEFPASPSVIGLHRFGEGKVLQFDGHTDTIANPHAPPRVSRGTLYGRGACDMKGALAAMVETARLLIEAHPPLRGAIMITAHGLHEAPTGTNETLDALIRKGIHGDAVVVGECADRMLPIAGRAMAIFEIRVWRGGEVRHETKSGGAANPIPVCSGILARLVRRARELEKARSGASLFIGIVQGGDFYNRIPLACRIVGTRRYPHDQEFAAMEAEMRALATAGTLPRGMHVDVRVMRINDGFGIAAREPVAVALRKGYRAATGRTLRTGEITICGNLPWFVRGAGIPGVYHGLDQDSAHGDVEKVRIDDMVRLTKVYLSTTLEYLGAETRA